MVDVKYICSIYSLPTKSSGLKIILNLIEYQSDSKSQLEHLLKQTVN